MLLPGFDLPEDPVFQSTGKAGISALECYALNSVGALSGLTIIAKFDLPERAQREWAVWHELRPFFVPPEILKPRNFPKDATEADSVIIYEAAQDHVRNREIRDLDDFLRELLWLPDSLDECKEAIEMTSELLVSFYNIERIQAPDAMSQWGIETWRNQFPKFDSLGFKETLTSIAKSLWPHVEWHNVNPVTIPGLSCIEPRQLVNPLMVYEEKLKAKIGNCKRSRIHGDMNLNNVLIGKNNKRLKVFLIDLGGSQNHAVTAIDFARLESEFWQETFAVTSTKQYDESFALRMFVAIRDELDGRQAKEKVEDQFFLRCQELIRFWREQAAIALGLDVKSVQFYREYLTPLFFLSLRAVAFPTVCDLRHGGGTLKARLAIIGAMLSLEAMK